MKAYIARIYHKPTDTEIEVGAYTYEELLEYVDANMEQRKYKYTDCIIDTWSEYVDY